MPVRHLFNSLKPVSADPTIVNSDDWNDDHVIDPGSIGTAELADGSVTSIKLAADAMPANLELELIYKASIPLYYDEFSYVPGPPGDPIAREVWDTNLKGTLIFSEVFTYLMNGDPDQTVLIRLSDMATLTKTFAWAANGNLLSITRT